MVATSSHVLDCIFLLHALSPFQVRSVLRFDDAKVVLRKHNRRLRFDSVDLIFILAPSGIIDAVDPLLRLDDNLIITGSAHPKSHTPTEETLTHPHFGT